MLSSKRSYFSLDDDVRYINGAYMSPLLNEALEIGESALRLKTKPYHFRMHHFFEDVVELKQSYARLLNVSDWNNISIIPSVSYGMANAAQAINPDRGTKIVMPAEQFPSNYYIWEDYARQHNLQLDIIASPKTSNRTIRWNQAIIDAIDNDTLLVAISHTHWADGTLFDLKEIRRKLDQHDAYLIIDGTQSIGALPFDQAEIRADIIVASSYKWLMGPYAIGMAYYSDELCQGRPIEQSWINRMNSDDFAGLVNYQPQYKPKAHRYDMGEAPSFINVPMAKCGVNQLIEWQPQGIQGYCEHIGGEAFESLESYGFGVSDKAHRAHHLIGIQIMDDVDLSLIQEFLEKEGFVLSYRGKNIRVSPNVYNTKSEMDALASALIEGVKIQRK